jgi:hypothetical protein
VTEALQFLGQQPPAHMSLAGLWEWAIEHWDSTLVPRVMTKLPDATQR